jgi:hypothetical protein
MIGADEVALRRTALLEKDANAANFVPSPLFSVKHVNGKPPAAQKMLGKTLGIKGLSQPIRG